MATSKPEESKRLLKVCAVPAALVGIYLTWSGLTTPLLALDRLHMPQERDLATGAGVVERQMSKHGWSYLLRTADGGHLFLSCSPTDFASDCLMRLPDRQLLGKPATVAYFTAPLVFGTHANIIMKLAVDGRELLSYPQRVREVKPAGGAPRRPPAKPCLSGGG